MKDIKANLENINLKKIFGKKYQKWVNKYPIFINSDIQAWLRAKIDKFTNEGKNPAKFNVTVCLSNMQRYCNYNEVDNPSEMLKEEADIRSQRLKQYLLFLIDGDKEVLKKIGFIKKTKIKDKDGKNKVLYVGINPGEVTIRNSVQSIIKSFFSYRGSNIKYNLATKKSGKNTNELYLTKDIIKIIQSDLETKQYKLLCKFQTQTGLRIGDILKEITNGKYKIEKYKNHYMIKNFETQKEMVTINYLFFTKELSVLIKTITGVSNLTKGDVLNKLFRTRNGNIINVNNYSERLREIAKKQNFSGRLRTHSFRKYFIDTITNMEGSNEKFNLHLEGHSPSYKDKTYVNSLGVIEQYYKKWLKIEKAICVDCIVVDRTSKTIVKLEQEISDLKLQKELTMKMNSEMKESIKTQADKMDQLENQLEEISTRGFEMNEQYQKQSKTLETLMQMKEFKNMLKGYKEEMKKKKK